MAMAVDSRQNQYPQYTSSSSPSSMAAYDSGMRYSQPHFTNPWASSAPVAHRHSYATALPCSTSATVPTRYTAAGPHTSSVQLPSPSLIQEMKSVPDSARSSYAPATYTTATTAGGLYAQAPLSATTASNPYDRRPSHPFHTTSEAERQGFNDALDASRGMVAMSQSDITPRNIYGGAPRVSTDAYGFPTTHSAHSSISSASTYPSYYNSSVSESSVGDYSSASESIDVPYSRTLPRPNALINGGLSSVPPAPQSMMGQFSSKVSSSSQKKHKCKICDKRFTRPSSLQTHIYSHTGEKPFACDVEGCGRHFSVVSNLRRHRKVHKGEGEADDHTSPDDSIDEM